jgi:hypothetical protein
MLANKSKVNNFSVQIFDPLNVDIFLNKIDYNQETNE